MFRTAILFLALTVSPALAMAQQPCTPDARQVVNELYRHMLERQADASSNGWVQELESGRMTVRDVVRSIATSPEHMQRFGQAEAGETTPYERSVARLYRHILGRQPDAPGQRAHAELMQRAGPDAVIERILNSAEYDQQFGDWGVPGSGGMRYCPPGNRQAAAPPRPAPAPQVVPLNQRRFRGMDTNNDGIITRDEWRGSRQSFETHDWNNDNVLSGDEVNEAAARRGRQLEEEEFDIMDSFEYLDVNNNNRIEALEWHGTVAAFNRLDLNGDNVLTRAEMANYRGRVR